ncbi:MAG: glutamate---cysteine ligase / carboxylate-amine ligase [Chloroflexota bacterium]|nr:glutamate---cysteine ligase / carboxylate-amine ligase [Chloroflexota bacterium]
MSGEARFTLGVEEEYQVVDAATGELSGRAGAVLEEARRRLGDAAQPELLHSQVEAGTPVCESLAEVRRELVRMRRAMHGAAEREGCRIAASGTHPLSSWREQEVTPKQRYRALEEAGRQVAKETLVFGCHVHVACGDPETTIGVMNRSRPWLPVLLALSASSPFWEGDDTGFASYRTILFRRWPTAGAPLTFAGRAEYDALVAALTAAGTIPDATQIYWDMRPSARYPTLEYRVADCCPTVDEAVMIAGLTRGLARTAERDHAASAAPVDLRPELLESAMWQAARDGLDGELIDLERPGRVPAALLLERLLDHVRPALEEHGDREEVEGLVRETRRRGNGATRQRAAHQRRGRIEDVAATVVEETAQGLD